MPIFRTKRWIVLLTIFLAVNVTAADRPPTRRDLFKALGFGTACGTLLAVLLFVPDLTVDVSVPTDASIRDFEKKLKNPGASSRMSTPLLSETEFRNESVEGEALAYLTGARHIGTNTLWTDEVWSAFSDSEMAILDSNDSLAKAELLMQKMRGYASPFRNYTKEDKSFSFASDLIHSRDKKVCRHRVPLVIEMSRRKGLRAEMGIGLASGGTNEYLDFQRRLVAGEKVRAAFEKAKDYQELALKSAYDFPNHVWVYFPDLDLIGETMANGAMEFLMPIDEYRKKFLMFEMREGKPVYYRPKLQVPWNIARPK